MYRAATMTRWSKALRAWPMRWCRRRVDPASQMGPLVSARQRDKVVG
jgi:acyl-CoA reductase-like NAD-dependent aldehyde dehydrogenase